jgi:hypothetical protein
MMTQGIVNVNVRSRLVLLLVLLVLLVTPGALLLASPQLGADGVQFLQARNYFPLQTGHRWIYAVNGGPGTGIWEVNVGDRQATGPFRSYRELSGYFGRGVRLVASTFSGTVLERGSDGGDYLWYQFGGQVGRSWVMRFPPGAPSSCEDGATLSIGARNQVVSVPAGEFKQVIRIDFMTPCADAGITAEWFAPGVGLIRREETTLAGPIVSELVYAELGQTALPDALYATSLLLSSPRYVNDLMPPVDPSGLPQVTGAFVVRNQTGEPAELVFPSSCRGLRLEVWNQAGELVLAKNTLEGVPCLQVITRVVLTHRSLVVPFSFLLADESGRPLPDGPYSVTAVLLTVPPEVLRPAARAQIEVVSTH